MRNELARVSRGALSSCVSLGASVRASEGSSALVQERQAAQLAQLEGQLRDRVRDMLQLQARCDAERAELSARLAEAQGELERLRAQSEEKERAAASLTQRLEALEHSSSAEQELQTLRAQTEALQFTLRDIAQTVLADKDPSVSSEAEGENLGSSLGPL
uniref:Uncharacterized protein n=3 Tax=Lepisosteus oculatus TaxID=7918 RepID=W5MM85_LEPOC